MSESRLAELFGEKSAGHLAELQRPDGRHRSTSGDALSQISDARGLAKRFEDGAGQGLAVLRGGPERLAQPVLDFLARGLSLVHVASISKPCAEFYRPQRPYLEAFERGKTDGNYYRDFHDRE